MSLFPAAERAFAQTCSRLAYSNPFLPERVDLERELLGDAYVHVDIVWNKRPDLVGDHPNIQRLNRLLEERVERARQRLATRAAASADELTQYEDMANFLLYQRYRERFADFIQQSTERRSAAVRVPFYRDFIRDAERLLGLPEFPRRPYFEFTHLFACSFQVRRAFHNIFDHIIGESMPMARLRARVWESIFTHNRRRYYTTLFSRATDAATLIVGPSGTGKELVARAVALSGYIPFDSRTETFVEDFTTAFHPLNISALTPTLVESELFGHRRGSFTGALQDRVGWLEVCGPRAAVFMDEIGELDEAIQVKLLRVLQSRVFQRIGDTQDRAFKGKIIAATNRDLAAQIEQRKFREDFYYRLCSDVITTPTLREQTRSSPTALPTLIRFIVQRLVGPGETADDLAGEVEAWIAGHLGPDYPWLGNVRELEQCIRNIVIHNDYQVLRKSPPQANDQLLAALNKGEMSAEDLLRRYCTMIYARTRNYKETARRLGLDHRTIKSKIDPELLTEWTDGE